MMTDSSSGIIAIGMTRRRLISALLLQCRLLQSSFCHCFAAGPQSTAQCSTVMPSAAAAAVICFGDYVSSLGGATRAIHVMTQQQKQQQHWMMIN